MSTNEVEAQLQQIDQVIAQFAAAHDLKPTPPQPEPAQIDRRAFLQRGAATAGAVAIAGTLQMFMARRAEASNGNAHGRGRVGGFDTDIGVVPSPYGEPVPTLDETTGLPLLGLPPGFRYWSFGWTGDPLYPAVPGLVTPPMHDGMGVVREIGPLAILCRNHEASAGTSFLNGALQYSPGAPGGNTNLVFDRRHQKWLLSWPTLSGTVRNCGGGVTPQGTWLSGEETLGSTTDPADPTRSFPHGWVFDVPAIGTSNGKPIRAMGRRNHEAAAVDPKTGVVYLTEDGSPGGFYRFTPQHRHDYQRGGKLEMLKVVGRPNANLQGSNPLGGGGAPYPVPAGAPLDVSWVEIADPENLIAASNFSQGLAQGGAIFRRPEGTAYRDGIIYFVCTDGGRSGNGQVFCYDIEEQQLVLLYDAPSQNELDNPDNMIVTPRGGLLFCEDNSGSPSYLLNGVSTERLVALTRDGRIFTFAQNLVDFGGGTYSRPNNAVVFTGNQRANEWAGACFDSSGEWLFANIQTPGITFAITGPWRSGPL